MAVVDVAARTRQEDGDGPRRLRLELVSQRPHVVGGDRAVVGGQHDRMARVADQPADDVAVLADQPHEVDRRVDRPGQRAPVDGHAGTPHRAPPQAYRPSGGERLRGGLDGGVDHPRTGERVGTARRLGVQAGPEWVCVAVTSRCRSGSPTARPRRHRWRGPAHRRPPPPSRESPTARARAVHGSWVSVAPPSRAEYPDSGVPMSTSTATAAVPARAGTPLRSPRAPHRYAPRHHGLDGARSGPSGANSTRSARPPG